MCRRPAHGPPGESGGGIASIDEDVLEVRARLGQIRSFIRWTAPLYILFLAIGLVATQFALPPTLGLLVGTLATFAILDVVLLSRIRRIETSDIRTRVELQTARAQIDRLARFVLVASGGLGAALVAVFLWIVIIG